ncbi:Apc13p protein-domain-containing protein [Xylariales sp. PMI_506]|nr:Apc13p protein-domain-containing protein [Xylariales sp. PMI_506]
MAQARQADLFEDFCRDRLPADDIYVPPHHQPINPEDEDDVVPDQHAAFGIQKATQRNHEPAWRDLGLADLMVRRPGTLTGTGGVGSASRGVGGIGAGAGAGGAGGASGRGPFGGAGRLPR